MPAAKDYGVSCLASLACQDKCYHWKDFSFWVRRSLKHRCTCIFFLRATIGTFSHLDVLINKEYGGISDMSYFVSNAHVKNRYCKETHFQHT